MPGGAARTVAVVAMAATLGVVGCTRMADANPRMGMPAVGASIEWSKCVATSPDSQIPPNAQCGFLGVPVDYSKPSGGRLSIPVIKFPATGARIGSLVINPGGPGESGIDAAVHIAGKLPPQIRERFDLVGFDPRGVGGASPAVWCNSDADNDRLRADPQVDYSPAGVAHIEQETKDFVQRCTDKVGKELLENVGTASVVKDLDALRSALGDAKLTYLGYSYGTRIGGAYAEAFPQNVRAMVLDGAIDPNADPTEADIRQAAAFQKAFDDYAADCAVQANCPLGTDHAKAVEVYRGLVDPLVQKPARTKDPRGLSHTDAIFGTLLALYVQDLWPHLTRGLTQLKNGNGDTLLKLADIYMGRDENGHYNNSTDVRVAVNCADKPAITDHAKTVETDRRLREAAPFMSYGQFTGHAPLETCAFWPVPPTSQPHRISAHGLSPTLVISTTHDPATPYQAGVDLAKQLGGALLTFEGTQHTVAFSGNQCVDQIVTRYLVDLALPPAGARC
jgi:pimeloyl-ACP methyl ester carboxylesterase